MLKISLNQAMQVCELANASSVRAHPYYLSAPSAPEKAAA